jgi:hypothetical protein
VLEESCKMSFDLSVMKVFLSYSAGDASLARKIASGLRRERLAVWLPEEEILPGDFEQLSRTLSASQFIDFSAGFEDGGRDRLRV